MKLHAIAAMGVSLLAAPVVAADVIGTTNAVFQGQTPTTATTTGLGTNSVTSGTGGNPNVLTFTGTSFSSDYETAFKVGTLTYYNGAIDPGSAFDTINVALTLNFTDPAIPAVSSVFALQLVATNNTNDPDASADYLYFPSAYSTTTFDIGGTIYSVKLTGFENIVGDGFLASDSTQLHVRENASATADLFAVVTTQTSVPEPTSWALMVGGFGMLGATMRRRQKVMVRFG